MHTRIGLAMAALVGVSACGEADEPNQAGEEGGTDEAGLPPRHFELSLDLEEPAIPQIMAAGRHELVAACVDRPDAAVIIFDPRDPGAFADVSCASMLAGEVAASIEPAAEEGGEPIAVAQQPWSPIGLGCGVFMLAAGAFATEAICPRARNPRDAQRCDRLSTYGLGTLGILCAFI
ncbi:hypothetical protein BE20_19735 [Sorangium cellulosum]|uniref:Uncharacterized protein n=1 Tax=Sorangium cellulosum TaxID=56 RepID=A0A150RP95_SORCE|nr:hypothetical protein BE18_34985 [Sorangium cellulosum]KYF89767.1 hypothetical protein BE20_19735 [Sorangium cellulosum]